MTDATTTRLSEIERRAQDVLEGRGCGYHGPERTPWWKLDIPWLVDKVRTLREALRWECEARDRAFALARSHEARIREQDALLRALARRQAVHDITCSHRFHRDDACECRLAPYTAEEVAP